MSEHVFVQMLFDPGPAQVRVPRRPARRSRYAAAPRGVCWRCWQPARQVVFSPADYAELLGLYLGAGSICELARTQRLRLFLDARNTRTVAETDALLRRCFPDNRIGRFAPGDGSTVVLWVYHSHLGCLFPQRERPIVLEPWQETLLDVES